MAVRRTLGIAMLLLAGAAGPVVAGDPFAAVRRQHGSKNEQAARSALLLKALTEVIKATRKVPSSQEPTPTEFFAVLVTSLEQGDDEHTSELAYLLSLVLPRVPGITRIRRATHSPRCG